MLLVVNRDSVCMGDDVDDHAAELDVDGARPVSTVVTDVLGRYRLASVSGDVAWRIELRAGRYEVVDGELRSPRHEPLALLRVPMGRSEPTLVPLAPDLLTVPFQDALSALGDRPAWLHFTYLSDGGPSASPAG
jgi:hypothetical protein